MACQNPRCMGNYNFDHIVHHAKKRFIEGFDTIRLLQAAESEREKEEIALVSLLDVEDDQILELNLSCKYSDQCKSLDCRTRLKKMILKELAKKN